MQFCSLLSYLPIFQLAVCPKKLCISTVGVRKDLFPRDPHKVSIMDFFGSIRPVEVIANVNRANFTLQPKTEM